MPIEIPSVIPKLTNSPLVFVLAQVRFSPITKIEDYLPDIQEAIRKDGFPNLAKRKVQFSQFAAPDKVETRDLIQWECINADRTASILFDEGSIVLQTTLYDTFAPFSDLLKHGLEALQEVAQPTDIHRIGFRCVNVIVPKPGETFGKFVKRELLGYSLGQIGERKQWITEALFQTQADTRLVTKYQESQQGLAFPFDLLGPISLRFGKELNLKSPFAILDLDHFDEKRDAFAVDSVLAKLETLHRSLDDAFIAITTPEAIEAWR